MNGETKSQIRAILLRHEGKAQAILGKELARLIGYKEDRIVRLIIRDLIADGLPVASSTEYPQGYFIVSTRKEVEDYALSIKGRLIEDALRRRDFRRAADQYLTPAVQKKML